MANVHVLAASVALVSALGCAPLPPIVRIEPASAGVIWKQGVGVIAESTEDADVAISYVGQRGELSQFRVELRNTGAQPRNVGPRDVSFRYCEQGEVACGPVTGVVDPERRIAELGYERHVTAARARDAEALGAGLVLLALAGQVGAIASREPRAALALGTTAAMADVATSKAAADNGEKAAALEFEHALWSTEALRRTTLAPGEGIAGLVFVPVARRAARLSLWMRVGKRWIVAPFVQHAPYRPTALGPVTPGR